MRIGGIFSALCQGGETRNRRLCSCWDPVRKLMGMWAKRLPQDRELNASLYWDNLSYLMSPTRPQFIVDPFLSSG